MLIKVGVKGVDLSYLSPQIWAAIKTVAAVWGDEELVITSTGEGTHLDYSKHYQNLAIDIRPSCYQIRCSKLKKKLEPLGYDVIIYSDHIHIEYDPKEAK